MPTVTSKHETAPTGDSLRERYASVRQRIDEAAARSGRRGEDIVLVAVTKHASIEVLRELIKMGHLDFGENRVQVLSQHAAQVDELLERSRELRRPGEQKLPTQVRWHMIGHLQRNKVRKVLSMVRLVHSVDSLRLAEEIQSIAANRLSEPAEVLVQVNVSGEKQKHGVAPAAAFHLVEQINTMFNVRARGLMVMAPAADAPETVRPVFERAHELFEDVRRSAGDASRFNILSMGMSHDFEVAIECGANVVRVGSAIFGGPPA